MAASERLRILRREMQDYLSTRAVTAEDRQELEDWVRQGYSVYENPWCIYMEAGCPADYLSAKKTVDEMWEQMKK